MKTEHAQFLPLAFTHAEINAAIWMSEFGKDAIARWLRMSDTERHDTLKEVTKAMIVIASNE